MNGEHIDKHIESVVEEVVEEIGIETTQAEKRRITHHVILFF